MRIRTSEAHRRLFRLRTLDTELLGELALLGARTPDEFVSHVLVELPRRRLPVRHVTITAWWEDAVGRRLIEPHPDPAAAGRYTLSASGMSMLRRERLIAGDPRELVSLRSLQACAAWALPGGVVCGALVVLATTPSLDPVTIQRGIGGVLGILLAAGIGAGVLRLLAPLTDFANRLPMRSAIERLQRSD